MTIEYTAQIWQEEGQYVAHASPLDVMSAGPTPEAARAALEEALRAFLLTAAEKGDLEGVLEECGYLLQNGGWACPPWVSIERHSLAVAV